MSNNFFKSKNPMIGDKAIAQNQPLESDLSGAGELMTVKGAVNKTFILFGIMLATSIVGFMFPHYYLLVGASIAGAVLYFITSSNLKQAPVLAPLYAAIQGVFVGGVSAIYGGLFEGIVFQAATLTAAILFTMLFLYKSGIIKVTETFRTVVSAAVGGIMLVYIVEFALSFFGIDVPFLHDQSPIGIGISLVIVGVASLNLALDFDNFEKGEQMRTPAYMEWYYGMGLLFTLIWLYTEILSILARVSSSD